MRYKLFLGYMLFVTIQISLMCQKLDLIEIESETRRSQMYGHNAGQPVSSLYHSFHNRDVDYVEQKKIVQWGCQ